MVLHEINKWHKTRLGYLAFGLTELASAYMVSLEAVNSGSLWYYILLAILLVGVIQNLVQTLLVIKK